MSTALAPDAGTVGSPGTSDPIDSMDLSTLADDSGVSMPDDVQIPDDMMVGGKKREPAQEPEGEKAARERTPDGKFAKKDAEPKPLEAPNAEAPKPVPFRYRTMGETKELEGATEDAEGNVVIPAAKRGEIRDALNAAHVLRGQYAPYIERMKGDNVRLTARVQELETGRGARETQAQSIVDAFSAITSIPDHNERLLKLFEFSEAFPRLTLEAKTKYLEDQLARRDTPAQPKPQQQTDDAPPEQRLVEGARAAANENIEQAKIDFPHVTDDDWRQIAAEHDADPLAFTRLATAEDAKKYQGVRAGQLVYDVAKLHARVNKPRDTAEQREAERRRIELAATNARRTQTSITAPPSASGSTSPAPKRQGFQSQKEIDDWFNSDSLD